MEIEEWRMKKGSDPRIAFYMLLRRVSFRA
jgi:hypothetical protein